MEATAPHGAPDEKGASDDAEASPASSRPRHHQNKMNRWSVTAASVPPKVCKVLETCPKDSKQPLTVFAKLSIHPGLESQFEQWYAEVTQLQHEHYPGYLSSEVLRPIADSNEYIFIIRYDNYEHLHAWMSSPEQQEMLQRAHQEFSQTPPVLSFHSLEYCFFPPAGVAADDNDGDPSVFLPPPKYKILIITFLAIWAMNQWTGKVVLRIFGVGTLPMVWFLAVSTFLTVAVAIYVAVPLSTALTGFWLFPHQPYTTSLRNGVMSLPWPIPKLVTWLLVMVPKMKNSSHAAETNTAEGKTSKQEDDAKEKELATSKNHMIVNKKMESV
jgi:antibiotic biosynthesis monooxygenase (ABM) superfamily enzyme